MRRTVSDDRDYLDRIVSNAQLRRERQKELYEDAMRAEGKLAEVVPLWLAKIRRRRAAA